MNAALFSTDFKAEPYWREDTPCAPGQQFSLPSDVDVLVVGSGYTGLHAALQTARAGSGTLVLDAGPVGGGCSGRNGGQVSTRIKGTYPELARRYGSARAIALLQEGMSAFNFLDKFIQDENIECAWEQCGHFVGAHNTAAYGATARALEALPPELAMEWHAVSRSDQRAEIGSDLYHGGIVFPTHAALHPRQYHQGLLERTQSAGAQVIGDCTALQIQRHGSRFVVQTSQGVVRARKVAVATNGYTGQTTPWLRRRIIPIGSYIIATEPLAPALAAALAPNNRTMTDSRKLVFYYRLSPDRQRLLFGGRVALTETDPRASAPALHGEMCKIFPQLTDTRISHSWLGFVGYTFDSLPHIGVHDGVHYAMGYCGSGISLASYCGSIMGRQMCGLDNDPTAFADIKFKTRPLYSGDPWFLKPSIQYYKLRDLLNV